MLPPTFHVLTMKVQLHEMEFLCSYILCIHRKSVLRYTNKYTMPINMVKPYLLWPDGTTRSLTMQSF